MIEAIYSTEDIRRAYNFGSYFYGRWAARLEDKVHRLALQGICAQQQGTVLEVGIGPGYTLLDLARRLPRTSLVQGIDLAPRMVDKARRLIRSAGYTNVHVQQADARQLPFPDASVDVLYSAYMLDLMLLSDIRVALAEFWRVLKPDGRLTLVSASKEYAGERTLWEHLYQRMPARWVPYILGSARPVLLASFVEEQGFQNLSRLFVSHLIPSEIVTGTKPTDTKSRAETKD